MTTYLVTGGTGFLGRHLLERLVRRPTPRSHVLVRKGSLGRACRRRRAQLAGGERGRRRSSATCAATASASRRADRKRLTGRRPRRAPGRALRHDRRRRATTDDLNVERHPPRASRWPARWGPGASTTSRRSPSPASTAARFTEDDVRRGPGAARRRTTRRSSRPSASCASRPRCPGASTGPPSSSATAAPARWTRSTGPTTSSRRSPASATCRGAAGCRWCCPDLGDTNVVPVDYVADAMDALIHADGLDGRAFHLVHPRPQPLLDVYNALAEAAGAPQVAAGPDPPAAAAGRARRSRWPAGCPASLGARDLLLAAARHPAGGPAAHDLPPEFSTERTREVLDRLGVGCAAGARRRTPQRALRLLGRSTSTRCKARRRRTGGALAGRTVVVTGASLRHRPRGRAEDRRARRHPAAAGPAHRGAREGPGRDRGSAAARRPSTPSTSPRRSRSTPA